MKVAYLHYHLKTGGVTTVIRQQIQAVDGECDVVAICGSEPAGDFPCDVIVVPGLGYDAELDTPLSAGEIADAVVTGIQSRWPEGCDLLHVHNPTLAKNHQLQSVLKILQAKGIRLFLQIHDFAEDGRPHAYFPEEYTADCHYGVLNSRDYRILRRAGLDPRGLHLLPNTVIPLPMGPTDLPMENRVLYPIRAIRRKNVGEALFLSLFFREGETMTITLPPNSAADIDSHEDWKRFSHQNRLNALFDAGLHDDFSRLVSTSKLMITTSITEGFGFTFLEPWTAGKVLWGRYLSGVCEDFEAAGLQMDHLYRRIEIPLDSFDHERFSADWVRAFKNADRRFNRKPDDGDYLNGFEAITANGNIDFGLLSERFQREVILAVLSDRRFRDHLVHLNPFLIDPGTLSDADTRVERNRAAVLHAYSPSQYRDRLLGIYRHIMADDVRQRIDKTIVLDAFLTPGDFTLLKWSDYDRES